MTVRFRGLPPNMKANMLNFCSLGYNCEFGLVQRHAGVEPLDLLRWAHTSEQSLLAMLHDRFARITEITIDTNPNEHMAVNKVYGFHWHTFTHPNQMTADEVLEREKKRLPRLAEKLMDELRDSERVFIRIPGYSGEYSGNLLSIMQLFGGAPTLVFVTDGHKETSANRAADYIVLGRMMKFGDKDNLTATVPINNWVELCDKIVEIL